MRKNIQAKLAAALSGKLGGAVQNIVLRRSVKMADKVKGTFAETVQTFEGRGICRLAWSAYETAALQIPQTDGKAVILQSELAAEPQEGDALDFGEGAHRIVRVRQDPVQAVWIVQYRKA